VNWIAARRPPNDFRWGGSQITSDRSPRAEDGVCGYFCIHLDWKIGFLRFLELGEKITEKDLLDEGKYPWMKGAPLAFSLLSSYDHHQEHYDGSVAWLDQNGK